MGWREELEKAGWREATEREYYDFYGRYIIKNEDGRKEGLGKELRDLRIRLSACPEFIVPNWYSL